MGVGYPTQVLEVNELEADCGFGIEAASYVSGCGCCVARGGKHEAAAHEFDELRVAVDVLDHAEEVVRVDWQEFLGGKFDRLGREHSGMRSLKIN